MMNNLKEKSVGASTAAATATAPAATPAREATAGTSSTNNNVDGGRNNAADAATTGQKSNADPNSSATDEQESLSFRAPMILSLHVHGKDASPELVDILQFCHRRYRPLERLYFDREKYPAPSEGQTPFSKKDGHDSFKELSKIMVGSAREQKVSLHFNGSWGVRNEEQWRTLKCFYCRQGRSRKPSQSESTETTAAPTNRPTCKFVVTLGCDTVGYFLKVGFGNQYHNGHCQELPPRQVGRRSAKPQPRAEKRSRKKNTADPPAPPADTEPTTQEPPAVADDEGGDGDNMRGGDNHSDDAASLPSIDLENGGGHSRFSGLHAPVSSIVTILNSSPDPELYEYTKKVLDDLATLAQHRAAKRSLEQQLARNPMANKRMRGFTGATNMQFGW